MEYAETLEKENIILEIGVSVFGVRPRKKAVLLETENLHNYDVMAEGQVF